jgi:hypothetical protein
MCLTGSSVVAQYPDAATAGVRSSSPVIAEAIRSGSQRSTAFAALIEEVKRLGGIVYIEEGRCSGGMRACLMHSVTPADPYRFLFVQVQLSSARASLIPVVGHELTHALEILRDARIDTNGEIFYLFGRIGVWYPRAMVFETRAARDIERQIADDLRRDRRSTQLLAQALDASPARDGIVGEVGERSEDAILR